MKIETVYQNGSYEIVRIINTGWCDMYRVYKGSSVVSNWNSLESAIESLKITQ